MDRSTRATLNTYNTWIQLSRLQKVYHFQSLKLRFATNPLYGTVMAQYAAGPRAYCLSCDNGSGEQHCLASMDSDLEAFSRNPTDGSFAALASQPAAFTKYLNEVFLSY